MCFEELESLKLKIRCRSCSSEFDRSVTPGRTFRCPECNQEHILSHPVQIPKLFKVSKAVSEDEEQKVPLEVKRPLTFSILNDDRESLEDLFSDRIKELPRHAKFIEAAEKMDRMFDRTAFSSVKCILLMGSNEKGLKKEKSKIKKFVQSELGIEVLYPEEITQNLRESRESSSPFLEDVLSRLSRYGDLDQVDSETLESEMVRSPYVDMCLILHNSIGPALEFQKFSQDRSAAHKIRVFIPEKFITKGISPAVGSYASTGPFTKFFRMFPTSLFIYGDLEELRDDVHFTINEYVEHFYK